MVYHQYKEKSPFLQLYITSKRQNRQLFGALPRLGSIVCARTKPSKKCGSSLPPHTKQENKKQQKPDFVPEGGV